MNPFNQAWLILKNLDSPPSVGLMSNKLTPSELGEYELLDTHRKIDYLNARMYTECDDCGYIHNEPSCGYCRDVEGEYKPNPQHSKTRFGNKEFANEKELLDYLELNPPNRIPQSNWNSNQFKLTNFADIGVGEKPVMYFHGTEGDDVPNIMREGLRPEKMQTHRTDDWERRVARVKPEGKHDLSGVLPSLYKNPEWIKQLYRRRPGEELRMQDLIDDMVNEHRGIGIHEDGRYYGDKKGAQAIRSEAKEKSSEIQPSIFMAQPTLGAKNWVEYNLHNDPQMIGVRGMRQPDIYGERNIDDTHDLNLPEKITQENIPIEDLVFYGGIQNPQIDEAIQNYRNMHEQGIVPKPGYFPTQEDYDRYKQMYP